MKNQVSLTHEGGWKQLNSISGAAWAIVWLLVWISLLLAAILMAMAAYLF